MGQIVSLLIQIIKENNTDSFDDCKKHPGHEDFITISKCLDLDEDFRRILPETYHHDIVLVKELIENMAKLTVKIQAGDSLGTGFITEVKFFDGDDEQRPVCRCDECCDEHTTSAKRAAGKFSVRTAEHVLPDVVPVDDISCVLFYDSEISRTVTCRGHKQEYKVAESDTACIECLSCARLVLVDLQGCIDRFDELSTTLQTKYQSKLNAKDLAVIIVSHPHGHFKHVTIGQSRSDDEIINNRWPGDPALKKLYYDAATCPGSSGAYVFQLGGITETLDITHSGASKIHLGVNVGNAHKRLNTLSANTFYKVSISYLNSLLRIVQYLPTRIYYLMYMSTNKINKSY